MRAEIIFKDYTIDVVIHPSCATESDFTVNITTGVGPQGYTPKRGIDYWTDEDKNAVIAQAETAAADAAEPVAADTAKNTANAILSDPAYKASIKGDKGDTGDPGYTPKRGVDYWTEADKEEIVAAATPERGVDYWTAADQQAIAAEAQSAAEVAAEATATEILNAPEYKTSIKGDKGDTGYTPVRGVDYWTDADKQIVSTQAEEAAEATAATMLSDPEYKASIKGDPGEPGYTPIKGIDYFDGAKGDPGDDYILTAADKEEIAQQTEELLAPAIDTKAPAIWEDASGDIVTFEDGAEDIPLRECMVQIEPMQSGSGDPSPDNVRAISGWTCVKVSRTGKNLIPNIKSQLSETTIMLGQTEGASVHSLFLKAGTYTLTVIGTVNGSIYVDSEKTLNGRLGSMPNCTFTLPEDDYISLRIYLSAGINADTISSFQLEFGSTATAYEPHQSQTYDITFPAEAGTVYGGTLDVVNGVLTADRAMVDLGTLNYSRTSGSDGTFVFTTGGFAGRKTGIANIISDCLLTTTITSWTNAKPNNSICGSATSITVVIRADNYENADDLKTALNGHHAVYELAAPVTYTLTPQEIRTLLGTNNIWADTGDTAVTYPADTKMFVEQNTPENPVQDVQVDGTSVLDAQGVANVPVAQLGGTHGVVKLKTNTASSGLTVDADGYLNIAGAHPQNYHVGTSTNPITIYYMKYASFYGLARAAGQNSDINATGAYNTVGQYTESAKSAISEMLNGSVSVSGTTPTINALPGIRYVCGEVATLDITLPASGIVDVVFESGSTPTVLTVTPPSGMTMKWANGFDPTGLEADTTYEINIADGCLGVAGTWS